MTKSASSGSSTGLRLGFETITRLGSKEAGMGGNRCDFSARHQSLAILNAHTGEPEKRKLKREDQQVREFYAVRPHRCKMGIQARSSKLGIPPGSAPANTGIPGYGGGFWDVYDCPERTRL